MWMGTQEEKEEHKRARASLERMKEIERRYEEEREKVITPTEYRGVRVKYVRKKRS